METVLPISGLIILLVGGLVAVKVEMAKRPTFKEVDAVYKKEEVCDEIHKSVNEKLDDIPDIKTTVTEIKTKIDIFLAKNGK